MGFQFMPSSLSESPSEVCPLLSSLRSTLCYIRYRPSFESYKIEPPMLSLVASWSCSARLHTRRRRRLSSRSQSSKKYIFFNGFTIRVNGFCPFCFILIRTSSSFTDAFTFSMVNTEKTLTNIIALTKPTVLFIVSFLVYRTCLKNGSEGCLSQPDSAFSGTGSFFFFFRLRPRVVFGTFVLDIPA